MAPTAGRDYPGTYGELLPNGPTEAMNNLIKRVKRAAFGFRSFRNYRVLAYSTPKNPTDPYWRPSGPAKIRRAPFT